MIVITPSDPNGEDAQQLINELSDVLLNITGDNGKSSYSKETFNPNSDAFFILYENDSAIACGALRKVDSETCEIKRMYSKRRGFGNRILIALEQQAKSLGYSSIILSTRRINVGARNFYLKYGYRQIPAYGKYAKSDLSICLGKHIDH